MALRNYANAPATTLDGAVTVLATAITVSSITGLPISYPYILILDRGTASEEVVLVTEGTGTSLTVERGYDSTTAFSHADGASVEHGISAIDPREANAHVNSTDNVHGVTGDVVGTDDTQTLTNKTISADDNTITGLASGDVVGTTDAQTLTNKIISATDNTITDLVPDTLPMTDGSGNLSSSSGKAVPTGAVVGTTDTQTLTNKTLDDPTITGVGSIQRAIKTATEAVTSSTSLQDDNHLFVTLEAGTWLFDLTLFANSAIDGADLKVAFNFDGTQSHFIFGVMAPNVGSVAVTNTSVRVTADTVLDNGLAVGVLGTHIATVLVRGSIEVTGAGVLILRWAQDTSSASSTSLVDGSWLRAERVL